MLPGTRTRFLAGATISVTSAVAIIGEGFRNAVLRHVNIVAGRAVAVTALLMLFIGVLTFAYSKSVIAAYKRRPPLASLHLMIVAGALVIYCVLALASGGYTHIDWYIASVRFQYLWWFALANAVAPFVAKAMYIRSHSAPRLPRSS
jgi:hypothetical protein